jgi:hypothetical protein
VPPTANPNGISTAATTAGGDAPLRSLCFRAWTFQLTGHEQVYEKSINELYGIQTFWNNRIIGGRLLGDFPVRNPSKIKLVILRGIVKNVQKNFIYNS